MAKEYSEKHGRFEIGWIATNEGTSNARREGMHLRYEGYLSALRDPDPAAFSDLFDGEEQTEVLPYGEDLRAGAEAIAETEPGYPHDYVELLIRHFAPPAVSEQEPIGYHEIVPQSEIIGEQ